MLRSPLAATPPGSLDLTGEAARRRRRLQREAVGVLERADWCVRIQGALGVHHPQLAEEDVSGDKV